MQPRRPIEEARSHAKRVVRNAKSLASRYPDSVWLHHQHELAQELVALLLAEPFPDPNVVQSFAWKVDEESRKHDGVTMGDFVECLHLCVALHLCPRCQYDLRASPDRCPECGFEHVHTVAPQRWTSRRLLVLGLGITLMLVGAACVAWVYGLGVKAMDADFWALMIAVAGAAMAIMTLRSRH